MYILCMVTARRQRARAAQTEKSSTRGDAAISPVVAKSSVAGGSLALADVGGDGDDADHDNAGDGKPYVLQVKLAQHDKVRLQQRAKSQHLKMATLARKILLENLEVVPAKVSRASSRNT